MLTSIQLSNFKCFSELKLPLAPLTLLSGANNGGKSSVVHAIVLLAQTMQTREWGRTLLLDGPSLRLGSASDVLNQASGQSSLTLGAATSSESVVWQFVAEERRALSLNLEAALVNNEDKGLGDSVHWLLPVAAADWSAVVRTLRTVSWITAERLGPRELLPLRDLDGHRTVGTQGELAAGLLYWREQDRVSTELLIPSAPPTLLNQARAWMDFFFQGTDFRIAAVEGASSVSLRFRSAPEQDFQRPQNVGFGLSQIFPIVVAALSAAPGELLIVENPEVHLHPAAQQQIGGLLAAVAASGVQVLVESHSDHVLNGIRLAARKGVIPPTDVALHFLGQRKAQGSPLSCRHQLDMDGRLGRQASSIKIGSGSVAVESYRMDVVLDECSLVADVQLSPRERIERLVGVLRALDQLGFARSLRTTRNAADLELAGGHGLRHWCFADGPTDSGRGGGGGVGEGCGVGQR